MIKYIDSVEKILPEELQGFFIGWPNPPSPLKHLKILQNSSYVVLAVDGDTGKVIGFINAISDEVLSAYIPLLEVLPEYHGKGIGKELVRRMLSKLNDFYMIDLCCRESHNVFYEKFGMKKHNSMIIRNFSKQRGI
jgi:ribosomal protein S18 acetylase RimI-like enzyme